MIAAGFWTGFVLGAFVGAMFGLLVAGMLQTAARADRTAEEMYRRESPPQRPDEEG